MGENHQQAGLVPGGTSSNEISAKRVATTVYILQALGFFVGFTFLIGLVVNYIYRSEAKGTWVDSHFRWQMRTFWFGLMWALVAILISVVISVVISLMTLGPVLSPFQQLIIPIAFLFLILFPILIWVIYRIVKGWKCLVNGKEMYTETSAKNL